MFDGLIRQLLAELREHGDDLKALVRELVRDAVREALSEHRHNQKGPKP